jgi:hypothetical protein
MTQPTPERSLAERIAALKAECERRLAEAQERRRAMCDYFTQGRQHESEREQELRTLIGLLDLATETLSLNPADVHMLVANVSIAQRIVEIAEQSLGKE